MAMQGAAGGGGGQDEYNAETIAKIMKLVESVCRNAAPASDEAGVEPPSKKPKIWQPVEGSEDLRQKILRMICEQRTALAAEAAAAAKPAEAAPPPIAAVAATAPAEGPIAALLRSYPAKGPPPVPVGGFSGSAGAAPIRNAQVGGSAGSSSAAAKVAPVPVEAAAKPAADPTAATAAAAGDAQGSSGAAATTSADELLRWRSEQHKKQQKLQQATGAIPTFMFPTLKACPPAKAAVPLCLLPPPPQPPVVIDLVGTSVGTSFSGVPCGVLTANKSPPPPSVAATVPTEPKKRPFQPLLRPEWAALGGGVPGTLDDPFVAPADDAADPSAAIDPAPIDPDGPLAPGPAVDPVLTQPMTPPEPGPAEPAADPPEEVQPVPAADAADDAASDMAVFGDDAAPTPNTGLPAGARTGRCAF